jgi:hypothetical protein
MRLAGPTGDRILEADERVLFVGDAWYGTDRRRLTLTLTALVHDLGMVTRKAADFERAGVRLLNPWHAAR